MTTQISSLGLLGIPFPARTIAAKSSAVIAASGGRIAKKQWYNLPNGVRVYATSEKYARLVAQYEIAKKQVAAEPSVGETVIVTSPAPDMPKGPGAVISPVKVEPKAAAVLLEAPASVAPVGEQDLSPLTAAIAAQSLEHKRQAVEKAAERADAQARAEEKERIAAEQAEADRKRLAMAEEEEIVLHMLLAA